MSNIFMLKYFSIVGLLAPLFSIPLTAIDDSNEIVTRALVCNNESLQRSIVETIVTSVHLAAWQNFSHDLRGSLWHQSPDVLEWLPVHPHLQIFLAMSMSRQQNALTKGNQASAVALKYWKIYGTLSLHATQVKYLRRHIYVTLVSNLSVSRSATKCGSFLRSLRKFGQH